MTPTEALTNLDQATSTLNVNRQTHATLIESLNTLKQVVDNNTPKNQIPAALVPLPMPAN